MGYIGLLLNDPYKIDRMMGCMWISLVLSLCSSVLICEGLYKLRISKVRKSLKCV
jgi:hypothetical protein